MISIIVPIYNGSNVIVRCLKSILNQSYKDLEIVLVNDGSTDNSLEILKEYRKIDKRIILINQINKGVAAARNTGLKNCTGDYFLFVDADDWIENDMIEKMMSLLKEDTDIVFCNSDHAEKKDDVKKINCPRIEEWNAKKQQLEFMKHQRMTGMLWNKLIRRELTNGIFFNEETGYGEDAEFLWEILKKSKQMIVTDEILYHHVLDTNSISHQTFNEKKYSAIPMWEKILKEVEIDFPNLKDLAVERLMCAAVFSLYEIKKCKYSNKAKIKHLKSITRKYIRIFIKSKNISIKFKLFGLMMCVKT